MTLINASGRFVAHATWLWPLGGVPGPSIQLSLQRLEPQRVAVHRVLRRLSLTAGQATVCASLHAGQSQGEIAARLGVAPSTVVDHVRKVYRTLGIGDAAELRMLLEKKLTESRGQGAAPWAA